MSCRCADIARCQRDVNALSRVVAPGVRKAHESDADIIRSLKIAADSVGKAINTNTILEVESLLGNLNKQGHQSTQELGDKCNGEIQRLSALLEQMQTEDRAHHKALAEAKAAAAASSGA